MLLGSTHDGVKLRTILRQPRLFLQGFCRASFAQVPCPSAGCCCRGAADEADALLVMMLSLLLAAAAAASVAGVDGMLVFGWASCRMVALCNECTTVASDNRRDQELEEERVYIINCTFREEKNAPWQQTFFFSKCRPVSSFSFAPAHRHRRVPAGTLAGGGLSFFFFFWGCRRLAWFRKESWDEMLFYPHP